MIVFKENNHSYESKGVTFTSVTTLVHKYVNPFDTEYWSLYKAIEAELPNFKFQSLKRLYGSRNITIDLIEDSNTRMSILDQQEIIKSRWARENKESQDLGTKYHLEQEEKSYSTGYEVNMADMENYVTYIKERTPGINTSLLPDLFDLDDGFYPELLLWNDKYKIAGQADKVFISSRNNKRFIDIDDYKTNKEIKTENPYQKMLGPLEHLDDCNYNHYCLQLSTYAFLLEKFGFKVRKIMFTHNKLGQSKNVIYEVPYLKSEVKLMIKHM